MYALRRYVSKNTFNPDTTYVPRRKKRAKKANTIGNDKETTLPLHSCPEKTNTATPLTILQAYGKKQCAGILLLICL